LTALLLLQHMPSLQAASLESIDAEIAKANGILKTASSESRSSASARAATLTSVIEQLHTVLESVETVPGLTNEEREAKSSEVLTIIFWCKKMMPLDLSGRSIAVKSGPDATRDSAATNGNTLLQSGAAAPATAAAEKQIELDESAYNRAKAYATAHPNDLETSVTWFESVAFYFPQSKWGERAAQDARQIRTRLDALRAPLHTVINEKVQRLNLSECLETLAKNLAAESSEPKKVQITQLKKDVENIQTLQEKLLKTSESRNSFADIPLQDLGLQTKGYFKQATKTGICYAPAAGDDGTKCIPWNEFGARPMIRLVGRLLPSDGETLQQLSMAATTVEDYPAAQQFFSKLLTTDPQRVKNLTAYFDRAQTGYKNSAEGSARGQLTAAKALFTSRKFTEGMERLTALQQELASNSSLQSMLKEVGKYRSAMRRQYQIDDVGNPITLFERSIRNTFAGDVTVDEITGNIEATYDFTNPEQFRDWSIIDYFGKPSTKPDWRAADGGMSCSGMNTILAWKFPISISSISADMTFLDGTHRVVIYTEMTKEKPYGIYAWCRDGQSRIGRGKVSDWGWFCKNRFIWRTGEIANVAFNYDPDNKYPLEVRVNGESAVRGQFPHNRGQFGFCFDGGRGTVANVHIKGVLDPDQLKQLTASK
jgi:hypothetical protein